VTLATVLSPAELAISADDVKALRTATMVAFDHMRNGEHRLRAIYEKRSDTFETRGERSIAARSHITKYSDPREYNNAFALIQSAQFNDEWKTVAKSLRAGDILAMEWRANANQYTQDAGLNLDELVLHVFRGENHRLHAGTYMLVVSVCPDNSARMIRP
jgi:hypothetical protein